MTSDWPAARKEQMFGGDRIVTLYATNSVSAGIAAARRLVALRNSRYGKKRETAMARGLLAVGLARSGEEADARREFKLAIPILASTAHDTDVDDALSIAARNQRSELVIEAYMTLLGRSTDPRAAEESFRLADVVRSRSVQMAVTASSARAAAVDPALAALARKVQDLDKQIAARLDVLNNVLALPAEQRDEGGLKALQGDVDALEAQRDASKRELTSRFPHYAGLIEPQAPSVDDIRKVLHEDEVFISLYFGPNTSFVWAVAKDKPVASAVIDSGAGEIGAQVRRLREAVDHEAADPTDVPPFDVNGAYALFTKVLKPVEPAWLPAKSLIVATNGALGMLPLSLLPTQLRSTVANANAVPFAGYRDVAWLVRTHAVTMVPSAASLRTLRQQPAGPADRQIFIGFGDPYFSKEQAADAQRSPVRVAMDTSGDMRSRPIRRRSLVQTQNVDRAGLAQLPRLPDTADELKSVALALSADPAQVLRLGKDANEETVKQADLSGFRIIEFATHALRAGDLDGLTQPALALTAPEVAGIDGDGLLTMEKVLALKLDADWVVLSSCNTAAGAGTGAEAISGLGRAFFYAGARTLLVTNWSVMSAAARDLVSDLFRRQAHDPKLTRAEALRQAMLSLMDGSGFTDANGKTLYSYAHPLFWAPYSIIGDGG